MNFKDLREELGVTLTVPLSIDLNYTYIKWNNMQMNFANVSEE